MNFIKAALAFLKSVFSEDGQGSYSRFASGAIVFSTLGWITYLVIKHGALPDLSGPALFIGAGSAVYGVNKAEAIVGALKGNGGKNGN